MFLVRLPCPLDTGWFGRMEPWGLAMGVGGGALLTAVGAALEIVPGATLGVLDGVGAMDGGALLTADGAALEIVGGATLGVLDGVGAVAGPVLFWPGPPIVRVPGWPPGG